MNWTKMGRIFVPNGEMPWAQHYAFPPTPHLLEDRLRLYVAFCDQATVGRVGYVDVEARDPSQVLAVSEQPVLDIGRPGAFDDNGVLPTCVLRVGDELWMYYVGYQLGTKVTYFQFQGLAVSRDGGQSFERSQRVPVIDRSDSELLNRTSAFVRHDNGKFRMWYVGGDDWTVVNGKPLPRYDMRYAESADGVHWPDQGQTCLTFESDDEHALGRPWIIDRDGAHLMFYSVRTRSKDYRLGVATSDDGLNWERRDGEVGIDVSPQGWDSEMVAYSSIVSIAGQTYMFYNGNGRGRTGFGYAILDQW